MNLFILLLRRGDFSVSCIGCGYNMEIFGYILLKKSYYQCLLSSLGQKIEGSS
jgi:hypothetical protein